MMPVGPLRWVVKAMQPLRGTQKCVGHSGRGAESVSPPGMDVGVNVPDGEGWAQ